MRRTESAVRLRTTPEMRRAEGARDDSSRRPHVRRVVLQLAQQQPPVLSPFDAVEDEVGPHHQVAALAALVHARRRRLPPREADGDALVGAVAVVRGDAAACELDQPAELVHGGLLGRRPEPPTGMLLLLMQMLVSMLVLLTVAGADAGAGASAGYA